MKSIPIFFLLIGALCSAAQAQTTTVAATGAHDPAFLNQVYFWAPDSLVALEKTPGEMKAKMKALGFGGGGTGYELQGAHSVVRIKAGDNMRFAIKLSGMIDPSTMIKLYQLDPQKKTRDAMLSSGGGMFNKTTKSNNGIDFNVQKSGADVYILIPAARLAPGEYGFMNMMQISGSGAQMSYVFFAFGIDQ
ncbi:MAG TPA: hypothetical protein VNU70_07885 [Puia sp.]|jgi:hypothetical protein|nr:hypothetical protein [Puia sp.]